LGVNEKTLFRRAVATGILKGCAPDCAASAWLLGYADVQQFSVALQHSKMMQQYRVPKRLDHEII